MPKSLPWLAALGLGIGLAITPIVSGQAAPAQSMLPGLESASDADVSPMHCRGVSPLPPPLGEAGVWRLPQARARMPPLPASRR